MSQALLQDVRYALRLLHRSPGFAATAIATLAVAIGANAAIFSAVKGVLIAPLPYPEPDRLVRLFEESARTPHFPVAPADFRDYRAELRTFEGLAAYFRSDLQLGDASRPEQLRGMQVTAGFFTLLGHPPALGREFEERDEIEGNHLVVVLSHALWMRRFNGDPAIVGQPLRLSGRTYTVVGVLPDGFAHVGGTYRTYGHAEPVDIWSVLTVPRDEHPRHRFSHYYNVVGRTRDGVGWSVMEEDLRRAGKVVAGRYPTPNSPWSPRAVPLKQEIVGSAESTLMALAAATAGVLLLACVNVAGLLLGRAAGRTREVGVRAALGATRARIARQLLVESVVLAFAGAAIGIVLAYTAVALATRFGPADMPRLQMIAVDGQVLATTLAATLATALLFGLAPAVRLSSIGVESALREGGRTVAGLAHNRLRRALAGAEVALAFVLVVASALLLRSFVAMISTDPGFVADATLTASIELPSAKYDRATATEFFRRALERVRALPGVRAAAFSADLPWSGYDENTSFALVGQAPSEDGPEARYHFITPGYLHATGRRLVAGRDLRDADVKGTPAVVVLNESAARKYWRSPDEAVGARLNLWGEERTVAGVINDVRDMPWHDRAAPALYFPQAQQWYFQPMFLIVRSGMDPSAAIEPIRRALRELDPELPLANVTPLAMVAGAAMATRRLTLWLVAAFGLSALFLAMVGIYGVLAQAVSQRAHEFGVRQALGATRGDIMRLVFSSGVAMALGGLAAGVALAFASTRLLASLLYGITAVDPTTFIAVAIALAVAAAAACYLPARRATRISAAAALRAET